MPKVIDYVGRFDFTGEAAFALVARTVSAHFPPSGSPPLSAPVSTSARRWPAGLDFTGWPRTRGASRRLTGGGPGDAPTSDQAATPGSVGRPASDLLSTLDAELAGPSYHVACGLSGHNPPGHLRVSSRSQLATTTASSARDAPREAEPTESDRPRDRVDGARRARRAGSRQRARPGSWTLLEVPEPSEDVVRALHRASASSRG